MRGFALFHLDIKAGAVQAGHESPSPTRLARLKILSSSGSSASIFVSNFGGHKPPRRAAMYQGRDWPWLNFSTDRVFVGISVLLFNSFGLLACLFVFYLTY
jgi:hypothetical protein